MRSMRSIRSALPVLLAALALGCGSSGSTGGADGSPGAVVQEFYRHLNAGEYASAMTLYDAEAHEYLEDPSTTEDSTFAEWARLETKSGAIDTVRVLAEDVNETTAIVDFEVVYRDGSTAKHNVRLTHEEGRWKLGMIG